MIVCSIVCCLAYTYTKERVQVLPHRLPLNLLSTVDHLLYLYTKKYEDNDVYQKRRCHLQIKNETLRSCSRYVIVNVVHIQKYFSNIHIHYLTNFRTKSRTEQQQCICIKKSSYLNAAFMR